MGVGITASQCIKVRLTVKTNEEGRVSSMIKIGASMNEGGGEC